MYEVYKVRELVGYLEVITYSGLYITYLKYFSEFRSDIYIKGLKFFLRLSFEVSNKFLQEILINVNLLKKSNAYNVSLINVLFPENDNRKIKALKRYFVMYIVSRIARYRIYRIISGNPLSKENLLEEFIGDFEG